ncbi:MAG: hypothetical protein JWQ71_3911 [Pedosphaera sp.]|nr:hypothetical protein [Pedosphaera sp.]
MKKVSIITLLLLTVGLLAWATVKHNHSANALDDRKTSLVTIRITDADNGQPVSGAIIETVCMGRTPYAHMSYQTNAQGSVQVAYFDALDFIPIKISKSGYPVVTHAVMKSNPTVSLKKVG